MGKVEVKEVNVLMVCLGEFNPSRSPCFWQLGKGLIGQYMHQITQRASLKGKMKISVDSAGTGAYHAGDDADDRTIETCRKHKVPISCTARRVSGSDFDRFDYILAMDDSNLQALQRRAPADCRASITLFGAFDPSYLARPRSGSINGTETHRGRPLKPQAISDPYYGGNDGFEKCYEQCVRFSKGFLDTLEKGEQIPEEKRIVTDGVRDAKGL